jgi:hypothetical protein
MAHRANAVATRAAYDFKNCEGPRIKFAAQASIFAQLQVGGRFTIPLERTVTRQFNMIRYR